MIAEDVSAQDNLHAGGCLCGKVRYTIQAESIDVKLCHCTHCRRQSGAAYSVNAIVPVAAFKLLGECKTFTDFGDSGAAVYRDFCADCGSPITSRLANVPHIIVVKVGTLDHPETIARPSSEHYCDLSLPWVQRLDGTTL